MVSRYFSSKLIDYNRDELKFRMNQHVVVGTRLRVAYLIPGRSVFCCFAGRCWRLQARNRNSQIMIPHLRRAFKPSDRISINFGLITLDNHHLQIIINFCSPVFWWERKRFDESSFFGLLVSPPQKSKVQWDNMTRRYALAQHETPLLTFSLGGLS